MEHTNDKLILWMWLMRVLLELVEIRGLKKKGGNKKVPKLGSLWINSDQTRALLGYHHRQKEHTNFLTGEKKKRCLYNSLFSRKHSDCCQEDWLSLWGCLLWLERLFQKYERRDDILELPGRTLPSNLQISLYVLMYPISCCQAGVGGDTISCLIKLSFLEL